MARIRSVKPGFFASLDIAELTVATRLHFVGLWTYADDEGRGVDDPRLLKAALWPLDVDVTIEDVEAMQVELEGAGRIVRYEVGGRRYFEVANWHDHQKPNRPQGSKYPAPDNPDADRVSPHGSFTERSVSHHTVSDEECSQEGRGGERRGEDSCASGARESLAAAVVLACGMEHPREGTKPHQQLMAAVADLHAQSALPHEVPARARTYRQRFKDATLTPHAMAKHWPQLGPDTAKPHHPAPFDPTHGLRAAGLNPERVA